jgi:diadenosine tetraphosphate (Ap4A) HIT family hydrolase
MLEPIQDCIFCKIISGAMPSYRVWEDKDFLAILDVFPCVKGQTLVIPKRHIPSYVFNMQSEEYLSLMAATQIVAKLIDTKLGATRTCMVMEGMEVDHAHIKLYPIYTIGNNIASATFDMNIYPGYITTVSGERASEAELREVMHKINPAT